MYLQGILKITQMANIIVLQYKLCLLMVLKTNIYIKVDQIRDSSPIGV